MKNFFKPNLGPLGRCARGLGAALCFTGAWLAWGYSGWLVAALIAFGLLCTFQTIHGWCLMRACNIRMPI